MLGVLVALLIGSLAVPALGGRPGEPETVVVRAGKVITVSGEEIERGEIVMVDGRITLVGVGLDYPANATVIDARDQVVMPGLIHPKSSFGVPNIQRRGINASASAHKDVIYEHIDFEPLIRAGFTTVVLQPRGAGIIGMASAFATAADEAWKRTLDRDLYLVVDFGSLPNDKNTLREAITKAREEIKKVEDARKKWEEEQAKKKAEADRKAEEEKKKEGEQPKREGAAPARPDEEGKQGEQPKPEEFTPPEMNPDLKPIVALLQKQEDAAPAMFEIGSAAALVHLQDALTMLTDEEGFEHFLCIPRTNFGDFPLAVDAIASHGKGVLMPPEMATLPQTANSYHLAGELILRDVTVGFFPNPDNSFGYERFMNGVAELVRLGLPREEALKAATLNVATIVGLGRRLGSIEAGKTGNLMFLTRDPLDPTARIARVMVRGRIVYEAEN
ncbi:MAG: amidohydrolase family protein [Phycisphaerales bacterium]